MIKGKPLLINLDDFDDKRILSPSLALAPHYDNGYETASHKFVKYPRHRQQQQQQYHLPRRQPSKLSDYFEDYYDHLYRDGTGFSNRKGEEYPETDDQEDWRPIVPLSNSSKHAGLRPMMMHRHEGDTFPHTTEKLVNDSNSTQRYQQQLLESFSTATTGVEEARTAKREVDDDSTDTSSSSSEQDEEQAGRMLKSGPALTQRRAREKAVFEMPRKVENPYTKWSKWTKCTAKCTTRRLK